MHFNQMEYSVIHKVERIYYPVLAAVGIPVNLVAIVILSRGKCGLSKCISYYLVGMAVADLLVVIIDPLLRWSVPIYYPDSFLHITPVCSLINVLAFAVTRVSVWLTVAFTFDRFVAICYEKLKAKYCTENRAAVALGTVSVLGCLESLPCYFIYETAKIIDNVPWDCVPKPSFFTSPGWAAYELLHYILTPCLPFFLILLFNVLTVRRILVTNKSRRAVRGQNNGDSRKDPELENRRKSIILLFSLSGSFVLLWVTQIIYNAYRRIADIQFYSSPADPHFITDRVSMMLQVLSSSTNTCIYVVTQSKFRDELKNAMKYSLKLIFKLIKN